MNIKNFSATMSRYRRSSSSSSYAGDSSALSASSDSASCSALSDEDDEASSSSFLSTTSVASIRSGLSSLSSSSFAQSVSSSYSASSSSPESDALPGKKYTALQRQNASELNRLTERSKSPLTDYSSAFEAHEDNMHCDKNGAKNKLFCDNLFFKFTAPGWQDKTHGDIASVLSPVGETAEKTYTIDEIKRVVLQRKICKQLNARWTPHLFRQYQLDKADRGHLTTAWQADVLSKDLLFGTVMTENDYQRINTKDKKRLLMLFHPDKHCTHRSETLYNIIFKKVNKFYSNYLRNK